MHVLVTLCIVDHGLLPILDMNRMITHTHNTHNTHTNTHHPVTPYANTHTSTSLSCPLPISSFKP